MDEGRLAAVRRRADLNRKNVILMNDIIKNRQGVYENYLNKEQHGVESKIVAGEIGLKRSIVRNSILMQCLETRKQKMVTKNPSLPLGKYGGRPIHTFSRDIESIIQWMHPRLRRLRKVEKMKENGLKLGAIIDPSTVPDRIEAVFGPAGERSHTDSRLLAGNRRSSRKSDNKRRRKLSKSGGHNHLNAVITRRPLINRRIEAPPVRTFLENEAANSDGVNAESEVNKHSGIPATRTTDSRHVGSPSSSNHVISSSSHRKQKGETSEEDRIIEMDLSNHLKNSRIHSTELEEDIDPSSRDHGAVGGGRGGSRDKGAVKNSSPLTQTQTPSHEPERGGSDRLNADIANRNSIKSSGNKSDMESKESTKERRSSTLILPPIKTTRELVRK